MSLLDNPLPSVQRTEEAFNRLQDKFPEQHVLYSEDPIIVNELRNFQSPEEFVISFLACNWS
jgi:hypothetical protein